MDLYMNHDRPFTDEELTAIRPSVRRRGQREPVAYITGTKGFWTLELKVVPGVLVPRPDTERLVEFAEQIEPEEHCSVAYAGEALLDWPWLQSVQTSNCLPQMSPTALECTHQNAVARV